MPVVADRRGLAELRRRSPDTLVVALVNNMPDAALQATEKQFRDLLNASSGKRTVVLKLFTFPEILRGDKAQEHIHACYESFNTLWAGGFDGMIVTGAEPRTTALPDEMYWATLIKLVDWAEEHTASTIWSCLAAHGAVLYLDGIARRRLRVKLSGVFGCKKASDHALLADMRSRWLVPHSRYNDLPQTILAANGYQILSHSPDVGVDMFAKQRQRSLFLFMQGHPEHDARSLFHEFRRDSLRYLKRERPDLPPLPRGYFDDRTAGALEALRERALYERDPELILDFSAAEARGQFLHAWKEPATQLYSNWLNYLNQERSSQLESPPHYATQPAVHRTLVRRPGAEIMGPGVLARSEW
jgi:homoserine O-succinyltransferase